MSIKTALEKLRRRNMNFTILRSALTYSELPTSRGWGDLMDKYAALQLAAMQAASYAQKLEAIYNANIEWGDKAVQLAQFTDAMKPLLALIPEKTLVPEHVLTTPFPSPVSDGELQRLPLQPNFVCAIKNDTRTGITLYFYSRGYDTEREEFDVAEMNDAVSMQRFQGYDHVVAYRQTPFLRIDSVFVDTRNYRIEFRVDATKLRTTDRLIEALKLLKDCFRKLLKNQVNEEWAKIQFTLVNFFPKIEQIYNDTNGKVVQLGHNTAAGAINHGKMRGLTGDLKQDPSHIASMTASSTEKFAIQKAYSYYNDSSTVHLSILGKSADTGSATPIAYTAMIEKCITKEQFADMMQILR